MILLAFGAGVGIGMIAGGAICYFFGLRDGKVEARLALSKPARRVAQRGHSL